MNNSSLCGILAKPIQDAKCPNCQAVLPSTALPLSSVTCTECNQTVTVPGELGNYRLTKLLGAGGMGGVYEGFDEGLQRKVAVKVILKERVSEDPGFIETFRKEAQAAAKLNSTNIVQVYAFGDYQGQPFIVMELVQPDSLDRMMKRGKVNPYTAMKIGEQVAEGLKHAAENGLVHGDVKPENILIDAEQHAKLADFGISALAGQKSKETNEVWGTPYYIAPETLKRLKVDYRADIYSLGGTLYHAIAGVPPFEGDDSVAVMKARLVKPPKPLHERCSDVPEEISKVIMRMLEMEVIRRYPNYDSLISDIKKALASTAAGKFLTGKKIVLKPKDATKSISVKIPSAAKTFKTSHRIIDPSQREHSFETGSIGRKNESNEKGKSKVVVISSICGGIVVLAGLIIGISFAVSSTKKQEPQKAATTAQTVEVAKKATVTDELHKIILEMEKQQKEFAKNLDTAERAFKRIHREIKRGLPAELYDKINDEGTALVSPSEKPIPDLLKSYFELGAKLQTLRNFITASNIKISDKNISPEDSIKMLPPDEQQKIYDKLAVEWQKIKSSKEVKNFNAGCNEIAGQVNKFKRLTDAGRKQMELEAQEEHVAKLKAAEEEKKRLEQEKIKQAEANEVNIVIGAETEAMAQTLAFDLNRAKQTIQNRTRILKTESGKTAAKTALERIQNIQLIKDYMIEAINAGNGSRWKISAAEEKDLTVNGKSAEWSEITTKRPEIGFLIIKNTLGNPAYIKNLAPSKRANLSIAAVYYCSIFIKAKSQTVNAFTESCSSFAKETLPAAGQTLERLLPKKSE